VTKLNGSSSFSFHSFYQVESFSSSHRPAFNSASSKNHLESLNWSSLNEHNHIPCLSVINPFGLSKNANEESSFSKCFSLSLAYEKVKDENETALYFPLFQTWQYRN